MEAYAIYVKGLLRSWLRCPTRLCVRHRTDESPRNGAIAPRRR